MKVKICGIIHSDDAEYAVRAGVDYIGIIFTARSKRIVSLPLGKDIADVSRDLGAEPVGVFMDQTADQIIYICEQTGIKKVQLHGIIAQQALHVLLSNYSVIYAMFDEKNEMTFQTESLPFSVIPLYEQSQGTGRSFAWSKFSAPKNTPWILGGGLHPGNVANAIALLKPSGVDVASGVEYPNSLRKDPVLVKSFIQAAKHLKEKI